MQLRFIDTATICGRVPFSKVFKIVLFDTCLLTPVLIPPAIRTWMVDDLAFRTGRKVESSRASEVKLETLNLKLTRLHDSL